MKRRFFLRKALFASIRSKFIAILFLLGVIPQLLVGYFSYKSAANALLRQTREQLGNLAAKTAQQVDTFFETIEKDIDLLSNFPFIQLSFLQYEFGQRLDTARRLVEEYEQKNPYFKRIHLIHPDGHPILTVPDKTAGMPASFIAEEWFSKALGAEFFLSDIIIDKSGESSAIILAKKVYDFEDREKPVGILAFEINPASFTRFVSSLKIGTRGYAFLFNNKGYLIYHPDESIELKHTFLENGDEKFIPLVKKMQSGDKGYGDYRFNRQKKYIVFTPCRVKNWSVGITLQYSEFMADIIQLRKSMVTFSALIIFLIIMVSLLFVKTLTEPINRLISGARAIGNGDLDQVIRVTTSDELQGLADEFNSMAGRLKKSMQEIVELKTFSDDILRSVTSGIITVDREGVLTSINKSAREILSFPGTSLSGRPKATIPAGVKQVLALLMLTLGKKEKLENQLIDYARDQGDPKFVEINTSLLNDSHGRVIGAIADIRDITLRRQMEELMVRVDKLASLGELSAGIAHEIRNPLAGMKTSIQVLKKRMENPSHVSLVDGVLSEIDRLNEIVSDLLKFSGPSPSYPGPVDLVQVLKKSLDLLSEKVKKLDIKVNLDCDPDIPCAMVDSEQIQQVFLNLMLNAANAMPDGGVLSISVDKDKDQEGIKERFANSLDPDFLRHNEFLTIVFKDNGIGITQENLTRVFDPFFTTDPNGTGLGLSIAHKLLEKNNACIYINSTKGKGCQVMVIVPVAGPTAREG